MADSTAEAGSPTATASPQRVALWIEYDGSAFSGWQLQPNAPSVQGELEQALGFVANHAVRLHCAGRTDAGVHATAQLVHFDATNHRPLQAWLRGANANLPDRVSVRGGTIVPADFHARFSARARRYRQILSVMMIDVDHFKGINDEHGHGTGDEVLRSVADLLDDALRETDLLARYGGDEFALLLPETPPAGARILAERLRGALEEAGFHASGRGLDVTFSCGIAAFDPSDKSVEAVIDRADVALYRAKRAGRNCIEVHGGADEPADTPAAVEGEEA